MPQKTHIKATKANGPMIHTIGEKYVTRHIINCVARKRCYGFDHAFICEAKSVTDLTTLLYVKRIM
jgi:hypothetical protein